ncbi:MAG: hypothetical protein ROZ09_00145 [Thiobacillus sp.]|jgi:hypothetical protein|uniref:hypothetical protein n=1 Tax=Thiobacillus sp. TaxID=924 RepID=UPI00289478B9|nr:hypothetical protein [Thiobacillus sp.]MDT3705204.1 hypothetical protein [Thiobacillus sp.]
MYSMKMPVTSCSGRENIVKFLHGILRAIHLNRYAMSFMPGRILLLATTLSIVTAQAAPADLPMPENGQTTSTARPRPYPSGLDSLRKGNADAKGKARSDSRYGIGYEARHGSDTGVRDQHGDRSDRVAR